MTPSPAARLALILLGSTALLGACQPKPAVQAVATPAAMTAPAPIFSINELMVMIVDRPGEKLWDVEKYAHGPKSDEDWYQLDNHAVELASAGQLIQLGGTGPKDMAWAKDAKWQAASVALVTAAQHARTAAQDKNLAGLVTANGQIVDACESCHKEFKPDLPTGGLFMHHTPGAPATS
jgi:cytochrome c556